MVVAHGWTFLYILIGVSVVVFLVWFFMFRHKKPALAHGAD